MKTIEEIYKIHDMCWRKGYSSISAKEANFLQIGIAEDKPKRFIEIGTASGLSAGFIALFMLKGMVIEVANLYLPKDSSRVEYFTGEKWFEWGNPRPEGFPPPPFGWAATQIEAIKDFSVQIYA